MKKWIIILGVLVSLIILLLIQSDGRKILQKDEPRFSGSQADGLENQHPWFPHASSVRNLFSSRVQILERRTD